MRKRSMGINRASKYGLRVWVGIGWHILFEVMYDCGSSAFALAITLY